MRFVLVMLWALWCPVAMWLLGASLRSLEWATGLFLDPELQKYAIMCYCIGIVSARACARSLAKQKGRPKMVIASYVAAALVSPITMVAGIMIGLGLDLGFATALSLAFGFILGLVPFLLPWLLWNIWPNPGRSISSTAGKADTRFALIMLWALWCPVAIWLIIGSDWPEWANNIIFGSKYGIMFYSIGIVSAFACARSLARQQGRPIRVIASYVVAAPVSLLISLASGAPGVVDFILGVMPFLFPWLLWNIWPKPKRLKNQGIA